MPYYVFGDTFCKDYQGEFLSIVSNTAAVVEDPRDPLTSTYPDLDDPAEGLLKPFIPLTARERDEEHTRNVRIMLWSFGGVVTSGTSSHPSYVWFEKNIEEKVEGVTKITSVGTCLGDVKVDQGSAGLRAQRVWDDEMLFRADEPRVG